MHLIRQFLYQLLVALKAFQEKGFRAGFKDLGGTLQVDTDHEPGARVVLELPRADETS